MNAKLTILITLLTAACSSADSTSGDDLLLGEYQAAVLQLHERTGSLVSDVGSAADVSEVGALHVDYQADMEAVMSDLEHTLEDMGACQMMMDGGMMGELDDAMGSVDRVRGSMEAMITAHADHTDVEDCRAAADVHQGDVDLEVDSMEAHYEDWSGMDMGCDQAHSDG